MNRHSRRILPLILALYWACVPLRALEYWAPSADPGIVTNNDCGFVSSVSGDPLVRRIFQPAGDPGAAAHIADRLNSGDHMTVPEGARIEWISGNGLVVTLGPESQAVLGGIRNFTGPGGRQTIRLDASLRSGSCRVQVRRNESRPETVLISVDDQAEILILHGDVEISADGGWRASVLAGTAEARIRRGGVTGAPFVIPEGFSAGTGGEEPLEPQAAAAVRRRLPFSFELTSAALPPLPAMSRMLEAP